MKKEDFERLKAKLGDEFTAEYRVEKDVTIVLVSKKRDIWDEVYFAKVGKIRKIKSIDANRVYFDNDSWAYKENCDPSTEQAYIEQLKKECFGRHNNKLESSKIDDSNMHGGRIRFEAGQGDSFQYRKDTDTLYWRGIPVYQSGRFATRAKERVKVEFFDDSIDEHNNIEEWGYSFRVLNYNYGDDLSLKSGQFLASQLEKYLNGEIE